MLSRLIPDSLSLSLSFSPHSFQDNYIKQIICAISVHSNYDLLSIWGFIQLSRIWFSELTNVDDFCES